ncbi:MAG: winged helix-turn-helix transcriptional regulator, partial [Promethearchaeota archaeon]
MSNKSADNLIKSKIHSLITKLDYEQRILFLLKNMGPQRFTDFEKISNMSKSTLSKYLNKLLDQDLIKKKIHEDKKPRYYITNKGIEEINKKFFNQEDNLLYYDKLRDITLKLDDLIKFYKKISIEDSIIFKIVGIISKIGDKFLSIEKNEDLFLTMFYIFLNSVTTKEYKFELKEFCKHYNVKKLRIEFYIDKIMSSNLGFYMFQRMEDMFFFHEKDIV